MMSDQVQQIIAQWDPQEQMAFLEGATDDQLARFAADTTIVLPEQYKAWLQFSDGGECFLPAGVQFYGVAHKPLIDVRHTIEAGKRYVVIGALSNGDPIVCEKDSSKIAIYNQEGARFEDDEVYPDFFAFLQDLPAILGIGG